MLYTPPVLTKMQRKNAKTFKNVQQETRGNLIKVASNAPHTLHALDSVAVAVVKIFRRSQNSTVGHVTPPKTPNNLLCIVLDRIRSRVYARKCSSV